MKIKYGNLLESPDSTIGVTTNGFVTSRGNAVMGRGIALTLRDKIPTLQVKLANVIGKWGNHVSLIHSGGDDGFKYDVLSVPVKPVMGEANEDVSNVVGHARSKYKPGQGVPGFHCVASLEHIKRSMIELMKYADMMEVTDISIPRPGCGAGELTWADVHPICNRVLDDRFSVYTFNSTDRQVFVSGSRSIHELGEDAEERLLDLVYQDVEILVGDCRGVDTLVQEYLIKQGYYNVVVYHIGDKPRNCLSEDFKVKQIEGNRYTDKDKAMSFDCDSAIVMWDMQSRGSKANLDRLAEMEKNPLLITYLQNGIDK